MSDRSNLKKETRKLIRQLVQKGTDEIYNEIKKEHLRVECIKCQELIPIKFNKNDIKKTFKGSMETIEEVISSSLGYYETEYKFIEIVSWNIGYMDLLKYYTKGVISEFAKYSVCSKCKE